MVLLELCVLSALSAPPLDAPLPACAHVALATPQGVRGNPARPAPKPGSNPRGGTPEPVLLLLVAGAIAGYGALRVRWSSANRRSDPR